MIQAITPAPYKPRPHVEPPKDGFKVDLKDGDRPDLLLSPGITYRRWTKEGLDFGSFYVFRNSWLLLTMLEYRNVRVRIRFRFLELIKEPDNGFLGISLRNKHYLANWGHLILVRPDGSVWQTVPKDELGNKGDAQIGALSHFDYKKPDLIELSVAFDDERLTYQVGDVKGELLVREMPYVYAAGQVRISTSFCRVRIDSVELRPL